MRRLGVLVGLAAALTQCKKEEPAPAATTQQPAAKADDALRSIYEITSDKDPKPWDKRQVDVLLKRKASREELTAIAGQVKALERRPVSRTFIGYRLEGAGDGPYWATTHYNPELQVEITQP